MNSCFFYLLTCRNGLTDLNTLNINFFLKHEFNKKKLREFIKTIQKLKKIYYFLQHIFKMCVAYITFLSIKQNYENNNSTSPKH